jgi:hypothetical protein
MRPILKSPRILRTGNPLTLTGIQQVCPAVFAQEPHASRGPRYRYVPTIEPLQALLDTGWGVYEASQQRSRAADRDPYTKHMLRLRKLEHFDHTQVHRDGVPEVILINAHDGTAAYHLKAGFFRFVCSNGLMVGTTVAGFTVRHTVNSQTTAEVLDGCTRVVTESFPRMLDNVDKFKGITLAPEHQYRLATRAMELRYGSTVAPFEAPALLTCRRAEDEQPTLWNVLNRVQENVVYGGWETKSMGYGRKSTVRPIERVSAVAAINGGLWDTAATLADELVAAA